MKLLSKYVNIIVDNSKIEHDTGRQANFSDHLDPALQEKKTLKYHPSILKIKEFISGKSMSLSLRYITKEKELIRNCKV